MQYFFYLFFIKHFRKKNSPLFVKFEHQDIYKKTISFDAKYP